MAGAGTFRKFRIALLLSILFVVGTDTLLSKMRSTDWSRSLWVVVYPINGDGSAVTDNYIAGLSDDTFAPIAEFMGAEGARYGLDHAEPVVMRLRPPVDELPPKPPQADNVLEIMWWSLKLRYWAQRMDDDNDGLPVNVRMFVVYHDPANFNRLAHSLGLEKGLIGVVNAFASNGMAARNNFVIAHEMLHTLGATDKYDRISNLPLYPDGYADPDQIPRFPQRRAELMGGRVPVSESEARMPTGMQQVVVGAATAREIRWTQ